MRLTRTLGRPLAELARAEASGVVALGEMPDADTVFRSLAAAGVRISSDDAEQYKHLVEQWGAAERKFFTATDRLAALRSIALEARRYCLKTRAIVDRVRPRYLRRGAVTAVACGASRHVLGRLAALATATAGFLWIIPGLMIEFAFTGHVLIRKAGRFLYRRQKRVAGATRTDLREARLACGQWLLHITERTP